MIIDRGSSPKISFLMRWERDPLIAIDNRVVSIKITKNSSTQIPIVRAVTPIGFGVYSAQLTPDDTSDIGTLLIVCSAPHALDTIIDATVQIPKVESILANPLSSISQDKTTIGGYVSRVLLSVKKYIALSKIT